MKTKHVGVIFLHFHPLNNIALRESVIKEVLKMIEQNKLADINCTLNKVEPEKLTELEFTDAFKQALFDSKSSGKQLMTFE